MRGNCSNIDYGNQFFLKVFYTNSNIKKIMIISIYLENLCRSWKIITNTKSFFYILLSFEGSISSWNNYNISLDLLNKNTSFEKNKFKFRNNNKKIFVFVYNKNLRRLFMPHWNLLWAELTHGLGGYAVPPTSLVTLLILPARFFLLFMGLHS